MPPKEVLPKMMPLISPISKKAGVSFLISFLKPEAKSREKAVIMIPINIFIISGFNITSKNTPPGMPAKPPISKGSILLAWTYFLKLPSMYSELSALSKVMTGTISLGDKKNSSAETATRLKPKAVIPLTTLAKKTLRQANIIIPFSLSEIYPQ